MRATAFLALVLLLLLLSSIPAAARERSADETQVLRDFEQILDLWRDGRFTELYEHTDISGKQSKEQFIKRLASAPRKPACCWEKMQEVHVSIKSNRAAVVRAKLGFEGSVPGTEFVTKGVKLKKEDGVWLIPQGELFTLANLAKRGTRYRYLTPQKK